MRRAGFTLIELMISLAITGVVLGAAYRLLVANQRFYRSQSVISTVQTNVREAMLILSGELREVSGTGGDIHLMMDTVMTINAMRTLGFVCALTDQVNGRITIEDASTFAYRAIDVTRDSVFVFREGNSKQASDDEWMRAQVTGTASNNCTSGSAGTLIRLGPLVGHAFSDLDSVTEGAPVRVFETITYRLFEDNGEWWLGREQLRGRGVDRHLGGGRPAASQGRAAVRVSRRERQRDRHGGRRPRGAPDGTGLEHHAHHGGRSSDRHLRRFGHRHGSAAQQLTTRSP